MPLRFHTIVVLILTLTCALVFAACDLLPTPTPAPPTPTVTAALSTNTPTTTPVPPGLTLTASVEATSTPSPAQATATPVVTRTSMPTSATVPSAAPTATLTPRPLAKPELQLLAHGFGSPDDIAVTSTGDILFGDFANNALNVLRVGATEPVTLSTGFNEPEGIVVVRDGAIIVAEQGTNRIMEVHPRTGSKKLLRQLKNDTGKDGVDGLGLDPATDDILVPDSPNGTLLRLSRDGSRLQTIASGFVRPTGAAIEASGSILVADEFGNALYRLSTNGKRTVLARMYQPDDVVVGQDGSIYVNALNGNIYRVDPVSGWLDVLTSGLKLPHGLGVAPDGSLVIAESGRNRILRLVLSKP